MTICFFFCCCLRNLSTLVTEPAHTNTRTHVYTLHIHILHIVHTRGRFIGCYTNSVGRNAEPYVSRVKCEHSIRTEFNSFSFTRVVIYTYYSMNIITCRIAYKTHCLSMANRFFHFCRFYFFDSLN